MVPPDVTRRVMILLRLWRAKLVVMYILESPSHAPLEFGCCYPTYHTLVIAVSLWLSCHDDTAPTPPYKIFSFWSSLFESTTIRKSNNISSMALSRVHVLNSFAIYSGPSIDITSDRQLPNAHYGRSGWVRNNVDVESQSGRAVFSGPIG